jgi:hypothetical protein
MPDTKSTRIRPFTPQPPVLDARMLGCGSVGPLMGVEQKWG